MNFDPLHITFGLYIAAMIGIGIVTYFKTANYGEYILGGRGLGSWVTAISAQAADFSGWILMGLPGAAYASGLGLELGAVLALREPGTGAPAPRPFEASPMRAMALPADAGGGENGSPTLVELTDEDVEVWAAIEAVFSLG